MPQHRAPAFRLSRVFTICTALALMIGLGGCAGLQQGGKVPKDFRGGYKAGDRVLVMLPAGGRYAEVADAVREGVLAASGADDTGSRPELAFADSSAPSKVSDGYDKGIETGASQVIGPLQKPSVDALASRASLPVPTLALNEQTSAGKPPANLYQFSLSPELDAVDVANKAHAQGLTRVLMIYPEDGGGTRRAEAFRRQWKTHQGVIVADLSFKPSASNPAATVARLLAGGDADFVFLAGDVEQARSIYPEIRKAAGGLPVIATASVYSGDRDPKRDRALAGLYFVDMPWMLGAGIEDEPLNREDVRGGAPYLSTPLGRRLYAMGIDAYRMAPRVGTMAAQPGARFPGQTGSLSIDFMGRIQRELILARFSDTGPSVVQSIESGIAGVSSETPGPRPEPASKG